jgi:hypothetical protein
MVTQPLQIREDSSLGHLSLKAAQGGFDPFVFADGDLGHEKQSDCKQLSNLAKTSCPLPSSG